jgi:hypothetical protein
VPLRGEQHRAAIRAVLDAFGNDAQHFVFVGGCVLGLYARPEGTPLRVTKDVDCISTRTPWSHQLRVLGDLCTRGVLSPDRELACRYRVKGTDVDVDVLSPEGFNIGGVNVFFDRASKLARAYDVGDDRKANAVTPAYFLATKVAAFANRGPDARESKDLEDIVALLVDVDDVPGHVAAEGIGGEVAQLLSEAFHKYGVKVDDLPDLVDGHLGGDGVAHRASVLAALWTLVPNDAGYYACIHGQRGYETLAPMRSAPGASRLAFEFQGPAFETDAGVRAFFAATFFPLRVVFDDERGEEHLSQGDFKDYTEARRLMGAVINMRVARPYDGEIHPNRQVLVWRVRLLTKDGRTLDDRDGAAAVVAKCDWRGKDIAIDGQRVSPSLALATLEGWVREAEPTSDDDLRWHRWLRDGLCDKRRPVIADQPVLRRRWHAAAKGLAALEERFRTPSYGPRFFDQYPELERWGESENE